MASYQTLLRFSIIIFLSSMSSSQKVTLSLYYEALCPYCAEFIVNHLPKIFENELISAIDLRLIPWGNAIIRPDGTILCQVFTGLFMHGEAECALNAIHVCAINAYPDVMKHFEFIYCTERLVLENKIEKWDECLGMVGLSRAAIDYCYFNGYPNQLERRYAEETLELNPVRRFVPWVVVNNQPLQENYENFEMYVCNAYGRNQVPEACRILNRSVETVSKFNSSVEKLTYIHNV